MGINIEQEEILPLAEAAKLLPRRRAGRKAHPSSLYRWANNGLRGVRLETLQVGGTLCTSVPAMQRFFDQLSAKKSTPPQEFRRSEDEAARFAAEQLDNLGI